jgi:hypothetical protein
VLAPPIWGDETHRLAILSEASELNLYQHLQPPKVSDQFSAVQVRQPMQGCAMLLGAVTDASMRERIRKRLREYRAGALDGIGIAVNRTKSKFSGPGRTNSHDWYRAINKDNEAGFAEYMDQSVKFIRQVAPGSAAEYVDELYDGGQKLKREIMAKTDHVAASGNAIAIQLRNELEAALDELIERKVEDFEIGFVEGKI